MKEIEIVDYVEFEEVPLFEEKILDQAKEAEVALRKELLQLANEEKYEEFAEKILEEGPLGNSLNEKRERFLITALVCRNATKLLEEMIPKLFEMDEVGTEINIDSNVYFGDESLLHGVTDHAMFNDDGILFRWLIEHATYSKKELQHCLNCVVVEQSFQCIEYLLSLDMEWELSPCIFFLWSQQNMGNPHLDNCVRLLRDYFLPDEMKSTTNIFVYPQDIPFNYLYNISEYHTHSSENFAIQTMNFHTSSPFMKHCVQQDLLSKKEIDQLLQNLELSIYQELHGFHSSLTLSIISPRLLGNILGEIAPLEFTYNPLQYYDAVNMLDLLLDHHPNLIQRKAVRCLVATLALLDHPTSSMVERVKKMTGKHLVITNINLPWFEENGQISSFFLSHYLYENWEKVMPRKMKPAIFHNVTVICPIFDEPMFDVGLFLQHCDVVGKPPKDELSELATSLIQLPYDHPTFLHALGSDGIFNIEKEKYLKFLADNKHEFRSHYLVSISMLKGEKSYAL